MDFKRLLKAIGLILGLLLLAILNAFMFYKYILYAKIFLGFIVLSALSFPIFIVYQLLDDK